MKFCASITKLLGVLKNSLIPRLMMQLTVGECEEETDNYYYAYIRYHSARAASRARAATSAGQVPRPCP